MLRQIDGAETVAPKVPAEPAGDEQVPSTFVETNS